jgi:serine/threonine protein kinase
VNIVKLYDTFEDATFNYLVLEYCSEGTLAKRIQTSGPLSFPEFRDIALQLLGALACCHEAGIAHLDIKPSNVFFHADGRVRLGDFGSSRNSSGTFMGGSRPFMSPEICLKVEGFNKFQSDIWSLGVTFYVMACGLLPWIGQTPEAMKAEIRLGVVAPLTDVDSRIQPLLARMLRFTPAKRASLQSLIDTVSSWGAATLPTKGSLAARSILACAGRVPKARSFRASHPLLVLAARHRGSNDAIEIE